MKLVSKDEIYKRFFNGGNGIARIHVSDIDTLPTIDATPATHGRWLLEDIGVRVIGGKSVQAYRCTCSECGYRTGQQGIQFSYCPKCGAPMEDPFADG